MALKYEKTFSQVKKEFCDINKYSDFRYKEIYISEEHLMFDWIENKHREKRLKKVEEISINELWDFNRYINRIVTEVDDFLEKDSNKIIKVNKILKWLLILEKILKEDWIKSFLKWFKENDFKIILENESENILEINLSNFFYYAYNKNIFWNYTFTKAMIIVNTVLEESWLPRIFISYKDRKRVFRSLENQIDFRKEFILTLQWVLYKWIYETKYPEKIVNIWKMLTQEDKPLINPNKTIWSTWYWEDRLNYTFIEKK